MYNFITQNWPSFIGAGVFLFIVALFSQLTEMGIKGTPSRAEDPATHKFYVILSIGIGLIAIILGLIGKFGS